MASRESYFAALNDLPRVLITYLLDMEAIYNDFQPTRLPEYAQYLRGQHLDMLAQQAATLVGLTPPEDGQEFHAVLLEAIEHTANSANLFADFADFADITKALKSWHELGEAYRCLYPLRRVVPGLRQFWVLPEAFDDIDRYDPYVTPDAGQQCGATLIPASENRNWYARYVPEWYSPDETWPVVISLHGAWGRGDHFLWSWVRPAKTRGYIVLSPKSIDTTWTERDLPSLLAMLEETCATFNVDRKRVLLCGLSDGGIWTYIFGLQHPEPWAALGAVSANFIPGLVPETPTPLPTYIMHGEADHMFPVKVARNTAWYLQDLGFPVEYHERPGYGHFHPPEENVLMLNWFERHVGRGPSPPSE